VLKTSKLITSWAHHWSLRRRRREGKEGAGQPQAGASRATRRRRASKVVGWGGQPWAGARTEETSGVAGQQRRENREVEA